MNRLLAVATLATAFFVFSSPPAAGSLKIAGATKYEAPSLVRLKAEGAPEKSALRWSVFPRTGVHRATNPRGVFEFTAPPGTYEVELTSLSLGKDNEIVADETTITIRIDGCSPVPPITVPPNPPKKDGEPMPPGPGGGKLNPLAALGRIQFGSAGCTATIIGPRRADGKWDILTAAHCISSGVGARGTYNVRDGSRKLAVRCVVHQPGMDIAWLVTEESVDDLPFANLAKDDPAVGVKVWHAGYGVDRPMNREDGEVSGGTERDGKMKFDLNVSSGDSGGGILRADTNEVVSTVCCTAMRGQKTSMWGGSLSNCRRLRPSATSGDEWSPQEMPIRATEDEGWLPKAVPIRPLPASGK